MMVIAHEAKEVANISVGEKASPLPIVINWGIGDKSIPDFKCLHAVLRFPR